MGGFFLSKFIIKTDNLLSECFFEDDFENIEPLMEIFVCNFLNILAEAVKKVRSFVDGQCGIIAPKVSCQGVDNGCQMLSDGRHVKNIGGIRIKALFTFIGNNDGCRLVSMEDGGILNDITNDGTLCTGRTHNDERLGRKIDMFFIFNEVRRDGFIAKLTEFYSDFIG